MADALTQAEIDALRAAVESGVALEEKLAPATTGPEQVKVVAYDFRKPHIVASDQHHALQMLHESAGKMFQAALLTTVKTGAEVKLVAVDQISYSEFVLSLGNPTYLVALATKPNIGTIALHFDLPLVTTITDILLGGNGKVPSETRELTSLELNIFSGITRTLLKELSEAWGSVTEVTFDITSQESNPQFLQIATPETACLTMMYDVRIGEVAGILNLCYPFDVIQAFLSAAERRSGKRTSGGTDGDAMLRAMEGVPLQMHVVIGSGTMTVRALTQLAPGDVICLDRRIDKPLDVHLGNNRVFSGVPGRHNGRTSVRLKQVA